MNRLGYDDSTEVKMNRLHMAGCSIGYIKHGNRWLVTGENGENKIHAAGDTLADAWRVALEQPDPSIRQLITVCEMDRSMMCWNG